MISTYWLKLTGSTAHDSLSFFRHVRACHWESRRNGAPGQKGDRPVASGRDRVFDGRRDGVDGRLPPAGLLGQDARAQPAGQADGDDV